MIQEKAIDVTHRMDVLAEQEFGESYTLKTTFWNDGDFRVVAYNSKQPAPTDNAAKMYVEMWYQDSKMNDGEVWMVKTAQGEDAPRSEAEQYQVGPTEAVELPERDDE